MIAGIGIDLCEIARMEKLLSDGRFLARFFSAEEQAYIQGKGKTAAQTMAGIYAAKEALVKALGCGIVTADLGLIGVTHDGYGQPAYVLHGEYARLAEDKRISSFYLSITHDGGMAAAVCAAERKDEEDIFAGGTVLCRPKNGSPSSAGSMVATLLYGEIAPFRLISPPMRFPPQAVIGGSSPSKKATGKAVG